MAFFLTKMRLLLQSMFKPIPLIKGAQTYDTLFCHF